VIFAWMLALQTSRPEIAAGTAARLSASARVGIDPTLKRLVAASAIATLHNMAVLPSRPALGYGRQE